jgi:hypothetical protein
MLAEDLRESNRQQADHVFIKLRAIGCEAARQHDPRPAASLDDHVGILAPMEHARWNAERWLAGWSYDPGPKSIERRTSPFLASWLELTEAEKDLDRAGVRSIPALLAKVGMKVCRKTHPPGARSEGHAPQQAGASPAATGR